MEHKERMKSMFKLNRRIAMLLALLLAASVLAGCGQAGEKVEETPPVQTETGAPTPLPTVEPPQGAEAGTLLPLAEETVPLSMWYIITQEETSVIDTPADSLNIQELCKRTNVELSFITAASDVAVEKLMLLVSGGEYTDLIANISTAYKGGADVAITDGIIVELSDVIAEYMPNYDALRRSNDEYYYNTISDSGNIGMIYTMTAENYPVTLGPVIRQDWLDALKFDAPVTYDDYYNVLTAFNSEYGATLWLPSACIPDGNYLAAGYGIAAYIGQNASQQSFYQKDGEVHWGPAEDEALEFLTMMNKWYSEGLIYKDFFTVTAPFLIDTAPVLNGEVGLWYSVTGLLGPHAKMGEDLDPDFNVMPIQDAVMNEGDVNHLRISNALVEGNGVSISTQCENVDIAARLLDYLYSDEGMLLSNYGIEGTTFEYDDDGKPCLTELMVKNPDGLNMNQTSALYCNNLHLGYVDWSKSITGYTDAQMATIDVWLASDNDYGYPSGVTLTDEESEKLSQLYSDIQLYAQTTMVEFIVGEKPLDEFDEYVEQLISMGIEECISIKQSGLDRYNARVS
jgi:putative aldouronate transport system substrate-binding protein